MSRRNLTDLREQRASAFERMSALTDLTENENRSFTAAEAQEYRNAEREYDTLSAQIKRLDSRDGEPGRMIPVVAPVAEALRSGIALGREQRVADHLAGPNEHDLIPAAEGARDFSLGRLVRGMATGHWHDAELEQRALAEGADATGGALVPDALGAQVIDRVRHQARVIEAGARTVPVTSDNFALPRLSTGVSGAWRNENAAVTEDDPAFEKVSFAVKTLAVLVKLSYELVDDMIPEGAAIIQTEIERALALELDRVALRGSGTSPEPTGIRNQDSVTIQSMGTNGATPSSYTPLADAVSAIQQNDLEPNAVLMSARSAKTFGLLAASDDQPLRPPPLLDGVTTLVTNQIPDDITVGTSDSCSELYTADWSQLLIGVRPQVGIRVQRLNERYADTMQIGILAWLRADIQLAHPEAFVVTTGVTAGSDS